MSFDNVQADFFGDDLSAWDFDFTGQSWGCDDTSLEALLADLAGGISLERAIADLCGDDTLEALLADMLADDTPL